MVVYDVNDDSFFKQQVKIDNEIFFIMLEYIGDSWYFSVLYSDNKTYAIRVRAVPNIEYSHQFNRFNMATINKQVVNLKGSFMIVKFDGGSEIKQDDFINKRSALVYMTEGELNAILAKSN